MTSGPKRSGGGGSNSRCVRGLVRHPDAADPFKIVVQKPAGRGIAADASTRKNT
jgi:hypothetical protein